jgi:hypothetical protein
MTSNSEGTGSDNSLGVEFPAGTPSWLQESVIDEFRLDLEAEFEHWCKRQVRRGNGIDCRTTSVSAQPFVGLRCFECDFVYINPTSDLLLQRTQLHLLAERIANSRTGKDKRTIYADCPRCGDVCISNNWPEQYSPIDQIVNVFVRFKRRHWPKGPR